MLLKIVFICCKVSMLLKMLLNFNVAKNCFQMLLNFNDVKNCFHIVNKIFTLNNESKAFLLNVNKNV